jgi:pSer/pThr/pTyr-binding forkhead associated (FHA) protein
MRFTFGDFVLDCGTRQLLRDGRAVLEDLESKNGTFLDGERVVSPQALEDGATIRLGWRASLVFRTDAGDPTETEAGDD